MIHIIARAAGIYLLFRFFPYVGGRPSIFTTFLFFLWQIEDGGRRDPGNRALLLLLSSWFSSILSSSVAAFFWQRTKIDIEERRRRMGGGEGMFSRQFLCLIESSVRPPKESSRPFFFARIWAPLASTNRKAERKIACHGRERDISPEPPEKSTRIYPMRILGALFQTGRGSR